jgi:hypothetical protein
VRCAMTVESVTVSAEDASAARGCLIAARVALTHSSRVQSQSAGTTL